MPTRRNFLTTALVAPAVANAQAAADEAKPQLQYRTLGRTGLKVTTVGFGCMITSDASVVSRALDMGITYFDTARGYQRGNNERMVGGALGARRKEIVLSSKSKASSLDSALSDLDTSLQTIGTDYLDIWYLHARGSAADLTDEALEAQQRAKKAGKIRFAGVSTHGGHASVIPATIAKNIDVLLTSYNFSMDNAVMNPLIDSASKAGLGVVAMKIMAGAIKMNKPGAPLAALKWVLKNPGIHTTVPSMTDNDQLAENVKAMAERWQDTDQTILAHRLEEIRPLYCRSCGACTGVCPEGVQVAEVLRYLSYAEGYGEFSLARDSYLELAPELRAAACGECSECTIRCPNGVQVAQRLTRAHQLLA